MIEMNLAVAGDWLGERWRFIENVQVGLVPTNFFEDVELASTESNDEVGETGVRKDGVLELVELE